MNEANGHSFPTSVKAHGERRGINRGKISFRGLACTGCGRCMLNCPSQAIKIYRLKSEREVQYRCHYDLGRCVFCVQCVRICPSGCLQADKSKILLALNREALQMKYD